MWVSNSPSLFLGPILVYLSFRHKRQYVRFTAFFIIEITVYFKV